MDDPVMRPAINDQSPTKKSNGKSNQPPVSSSNDQHIPFSNLKGRRSILKKREEDTGRDKERNRSDSAGNQIKPGGKKHKIVFKEKLCEIKEVECWKEYNAEDPEIETKTCCKTF